MLGAIDGADNADALEAWGDFVWQSRCLAGACISIGTTAREVTVGASSHCKTKALRFGLELAATDTMNVLLTIQNFRYSTVDFAGCELRGTDSASDDVPLANRLASVGLEIVNGPRADMLGVITAFNFYYWAVALDFTGASSFSKLPYIRAFNCGSSPITGGGDDLSANWSSPVRSGTQASLGQTTTITVDAIPAVDDPSVMQRCVKIAGYYYRIDSIDTSGASPKLILSMPWLDATSYDDGNGSGTLDYVFGGMLALRGGDTSRMSVAGDAVRCGFGVLDQALYGADIRFLGSHSSEVFLGFGTGTNSSQLGGKLHGGYLENGATAQILSFSQNSSGREMAELGGEAIRFGRWFKHGPRNNSDLLTNQRLNEFANIAGAEGFMPVAQEGFVFTTTYDPPSIAAGGSASTTLTLPNAVLNSPLQAQFTASLEGLILFASVTAVWVAGNGQATVTLFNPTGAAIDASSGTVTVKVLR